MKSLRLTLTLIIAALLILGLTVSQVMAQSYPKPVGFVNDFAGILSQEVQTSLESRLAQLEKDTTAEVAFVSVDNLGGSTLEEYAAGIFADWGIGKKGKDNGVLFLVSLAEGDMRIEVGYGLEPIITDGRAGRILDNEVLPYVKQGDFDTGIENGIMAIENYIRDGTPPSILEENPIQKAMDRFHLPTWLLITAGVLSIYMLGFMARTKSIWLGGVWGFILGIIFGFGFGGWVFLVSLPIGGAILGTLLDAVLSGNYRGRSSGGLPTGFFSSWGGFSGSGGGFGGGFGGFGGGGSGGGGASRRF